MKEAIKVKTYFSGWVEVTEEQARGFVKHLLKNITTMKEEEKIDYINQNRLQGITVEKLLEEDTRGRLYEK